MSTTTIDSCRDIQILASRKKVLPLIRLHVRVQRPIHLLGQMLKSIFIKFHMCAAHVSMCNVTQRLCGVGDVYQKVSIRFFLSTLGARAHPAQRRVHLDAHHQSNDFFWLYMFLWWARIFWLNTIISVQRIL